MASSASTVSGFPQIHVPFVDSKGVLTREWFYLLQTLYNRTGGAQGGGGTPGPAGPQGVIGPFLFPDDSQGDEIFFVPPVLAPFLFVDEKGSGGTPGFAAGVDFVAGTTTTLTLSNEYPSAANLFVTFDAGWQGADQFSLSGRVVTFNSAIPVGTSKVFVKGFL